MLKPILCKSKYFIHSALNLMQYYINKSLVLCFGKNKLTFACQRTKYECKSYGSLSTVNFAQYK